MSGSKSSARTLKHSLCSLRLSRLEEHYIETLSVLHAFIKARVFTTFLIGLLALSRTVEFICIVCQNPKSCTFKSVKRSKSCMLKSEFNVVDIEIHVGCHTIIIGIRVQCSRHRDSCRLPHHYHRNPVGCQYHDGRFRTNQDRRFSSVVGLAAVDSKTSSPQQTPELRGRKGGAAAGDSWVAVVRFRRPRGLTARTVTVAAVGEVVRLK